MTTRIASLASNSRLVNLLLKTQNRVHESELRVSTKQSSQDYVGIARDSERLVNMENSSSQLNRYIRNNELMQLRLDTTVTTIDVIRQTINDFRRQLSDYGSTGSTEEAAVDSIQEAAIRAMKTLESYLNTEVDGRFLFAGSQVTNEPVDFDFITLDEFQALYNGNTITYPTRRDTHVHPKLTAATGFPSNPTGAGYTTLSFTDATDTITAANAGAFGNIPAGATITISGTTGGTYDGTYTVSSNDGTNIVVSEGLASGNLAGQAAVTITVDTSYYGGDEISMTHRTDDDRDFEFDTTALHPAFEKAIRAMGIIAQGAYGTAGGLDQNQGRIDQAKYLLDSALFSTVNGTPPFGTEQSGNIESLQQTIGFQQVLLDRTNKNDKNLIAHLEGRIGQIEDVDPLESIVQLTNDTRTLEAAYRALARIRELGLQDFLD